MDKDYDILAAQVTDYIGTVQPQLEKVATLEGKVAEYEKSIETFQKQAEAEKSAKANFKAAFTKRATEALNALAEAGLVSKNDVTPMVEKSAEDPTSVWGLVEKIAAATGPQTLGSKSRVTIPSEEMDPFMREFGNYENADPGVID